MATRSKVKEPRQTYPTNEYGVVLRANMPAMYRQQQAHPSASAANRREAETDGDEEYFTPPKIPNSARIYNNPYQQQEEDDIPEQRGLSPYQPPPQVKRHSLLAWIGQHKLLTVGLLLLLLLVGYISVGTFLAWMQQAINDISYGHPPTFKLYADVNHYGQPSLLLAINDQGEVKVIETQKGHPERSKIYVVVTLPADQASVPLTLSLQDINGDGLPDLIVHYHETEFPLYNNGTGFQSTPPVPNK